MFSAEGNMNVEVDSSDSDEESESGELPKGGGAQTQTTAGVDSDEELEVFSGSASRAVPSVAKKATSDGKPSFGMLLFYKQYHIFVVGLLTSYPNCFLWCINITWLQQLLK
jgi:hypothetical protein